jgi:hypothetical protein
MPNIPVSKIIATIGGSALTGAAVWLNAEHVASSEGWHSSLVMAGVIVTLCAASAPPLAERAAKNGEPFKAFVLWTFFLLTIGFSLSSSIARSSGYAADKTASAEHSNEAARLAKEAYETAKALQEAECKTGRGNRCRAAEQAVVDARKALSTMTPTQSADPGTERLAAVLKIDQSTVQLYVPLFLPLGLELGGFIFLALGLAPRRHEEPIARPVQEVASPMRDDAKEPRTDANYSQAIATMMQAAAKPAAAGTRAYYLARLDRDFPEIAKRVHDGKLSVFRGCVEAGIRKAPAKTAKWNEPGSYATMINANA